MQVRFPARRGSGHRCLATCSCSAQCGGKLSFWKGLDPLRLPTQKPMRHPSKTLKSVSPERATAVCR